MRRLAILFLACAFGVMPLIAWAADEGQADLDSAIEAKLDAEDLTSLLKVINLCESALDKGLNEDNKDFAEKLLAATLAQRGVVMGEAIMSRRAAGADPATLRRLAIADLERAVKYDDRLSNAHAMLAKLYAMVKEDRPKAIPEIDKALELGEMRNSDLLLLRAGMHESTEDQLADLNKAQELFPKDPQPLRTRGAWYLGEKKPKEALKDFDAAIELSPEDAGLHQGRGLALTQLEKYDEAKEAYSKAAELAPTSADPYLQRARINFVKGDIEKAIDDLTKAIEIDKNNPTALLMRAQAYNSQQKQDEALTDVNRALELMPGSPMVLQSRAIIYMAQRKWDAAIKDLNRVRKEEPNALETYVQLSAAHVGKKDHDSAIRVLGEALTIDPKYAPGLRARADAYLGLGKQKEAIADYEAALQVKPEDTGVLNNLAWVLATSPHDELRDGERSIKLATDACEKTEYKQAHILSTLAAGYAETGDFETARKWSRKSLELADEDIKANLENELKSYEKEEKWRELEAPGADDDSDAKEEPKTATAEAESKSSEE